MKKNELNNPQGNFSLQISTLVGVPDKDFIHIQLQTINTAESKSVNNSLHAPYRKCSLGIRQRNPKEEVA